METSDYRELVEVIEAAFHEVGLGALADPLAYTVLGPDEEHRLTTPENRLIAMLEALDRHIATSDRRIVELALGQINEVLVDGELEDAQYVPIPEDSPPTGTPPPTPLDPLGRTKSLRGVPDVRELREEIRRLVRELREDSGR